MKTTTATEEQEEETYEKHIWRLFGGDKIYKWAPPNDTGATVSVTIAETDWSRLIGDTLLLEPYTGLCGYSGYQLVIASRTSYSEVTYEQQKTSLPCTATF